MAGVHDFVPVHYISITQFGSHNSKDFGLWFDAAQKKRMNTMGVTLPQVLEMLLEQRTLLLRRVKLNCPGRVSEYPSGSTLI